MNIDQAKAIHIDQLLLQLGFQPTKQQGGRFWYRSPFRHEKTASFVLSKDGMAWYDHGEGKGGNIIDLAMRLGHCTDVAGALAYLEQATDQMAQSTPPIHQRSPVVTPPAYRLEATQTMADRRGENWCRSRGLDVEACRPWLSDVYFNRVAKPLPFHLYGVGLPNVAQGFEMRTQLTGGHWIKSSIGPKTISVFQADSPKAPWYLFEGLPDFATFLTHRRPAVREFNFLILNGTGMTAQAIDFLQQQPTGHLTLCPQHGSQGSLASCATLRAFAVSASWGSGDIDYPTSFYDYNAWHMSKKGLTPTSQKLAAGAGLKSTPKWGR